MKNFCAAVSTVVLTAVAFAGATIGLNVAAGLISFTSEVLLSGLILGGLLALGSWLLTAFTGRTSRDVLCFAFSMALCTILALAWRIHFDLAREALIAYGAIAVVGFISGVAGSGATRAIFGAPEVPKE